MSELGVERICGGFSGGVLSSNQQNFEFPASSEIYIGLVHCGSATSGIACPWPSTPWGGSF